MASICGAAMSSLVFGYNIGVINTAGDKIKRWIAESHDYFPVCLKFYEKSCGAFVIRINLDCWS